MKISFSRRYVGASILTISALNSVFLEETTANPLFWFIARLIARSAVRGGVRSATSRALSTAVRRGGRTTAVGQSASTRASSLQALSARALRAQGRTRMINIEVSAGVSFSVPIDTPVWQAGSEDNVVELAFRSNVKEDGYLPIGISAIDLDDGEIEDQTFIEIPVLSGEYSDVFVVPRSLRSVKSGRKIIVGSVPSEFSGDVEISPEPVVIVKG